MPRELLSGADVKGPLLLNGSAGTTGQVVTSQGPNTTPQWSTGVTDTTARQLSMAFSYLFG